MKPEKYNLTFLTPCFCAGADQSVAEIRPSAIRGQLRWWFRALGGTHEQERNMFGGIADNEADLRSSPIIVRCGSVNLAPAWNPPAFSQNETSSYVWYFASVSGTKTKGHTGPRWNAQGAISPKSSFELHICYRRPLPCELGQLFQQALKCFLMLGGMGLRVTRGLGVFDCKEMPFNMNDVSPMLLNAGFAIENLGNTGDLETTIRKIGSLVKGTRKWTFPRFSCASILPIEIEAHLRRIDRLGFLEGVAPPPTLGKDAGESVGYGVVEELRDPVDALGRMRDVRGEYLQALP